MNAHASDSKSVFAGGCFWCMEAELEKLDGVKSVTSGYTGGTMENPNYYDVGSGKTGHTEAVEVIYDPAKITYEKLLESFWDNIDPTDAGGQFFDRGSQYRTAIFYETDAQKTAAEVSMAKRQALLSKPIVTTIEPATPFYEAEANHQNYYKTNSDHYNAYKKGSGREKTLEKIWSGKKATGGGQ